MSAEDRISCFSGDIRKVNISFATPLVGECLWAWVESGHSDQLHRLEDNVVSS